MHLCELSTEQWKQLFNELRVAAYRMTGGTSTSGTHRGTALVSEALLKVIGKDVEFDSLRQLAQYWRRTMVTTYIDRHRSRTRHAPQAEQLSEQLETSELIDNQDDLVEAGRLMQRLERDRFVKNGAIIADVAAMRLSLGLELQAIASELAIPETQVREHLKFFAAWAREELLEGAP